MSNLSKPIGKGDLSTISLGLTRDPLKFTHIAQQTNGSETQEQVSFAELVRRVQSPIEKTDLRRRRVFANDEDMGFSKDGTHAIRLCMGLLDSESHSASHDLAFLTVFDYKLAEDGLWDTTHIDHFIPLDWAAKIVTETELRARQEIEAVVRQQVERGVAQGVTKAIQETTATKRQIEDEKARLQTEIKRLEEMETRVVAREEKERQKQAEREAKRQQRGRSGWVYLTQSPSGMYKIGRSSDLNNRLKTFKTKLPFEIEYVVTIQTDDMYALERRLHDRFTKVRVGGEFFALSERDVRIIQRLGRLLASA